MVSCAGLTLMKNKNTAPVHGAVRYAVIVSSCIEFVRLRLSHPPRKRSTRITHCAPTQALGTHHALTLSACCLTAQQERGALDRQPWRHAGEIIRFTIPEGTRKYTRYLIVQLSHCCLDVPALSTCAGGDQGVPGAASVQSPAGVCAACER